MAAIRGRCYHFWVLLSGAASPPTVWCCFAAWHGRSVATLADPRLLRAEIYVGEPHARSGGRPRAYVSGGGGGLVAGVGCGLLVSVVQDSAGPKVAWVGACLEMSPAEVSAVTPTDK
eukprot:14275813-Alexandrium_andersonii.AAC.1